MQIKDQDFYYGQLKLVIEIQCVLDNTVVIAPENLSTLFIYLDGYYILCELLKLPTSVIPIVKAKIEVMLRRNEVESMSAEDIPSSDRLEHWQNSCHASIYGPSKALNALIHLIITGGLDSDINTHDVFRFKDVDFGNDGNGETEKDLIYSSKQSLKSLCDEKTFSYNGFWNIMSHCIREKFPKKNTDCSILKAIMQQLNSNNAYHFTTTPALASACKQYFVNFENMWSHDQYRQDLRVCITLLLRINLARSRFFNKKKYEAKKIDDSKKSQGVSKKIKAKKALSQKMEALFKLLIKFQGSKYRKMHCIAKILKHLFSSTDCAIPPYYDDIKSNDESPGVADAENKDEHEEDRLSSDDEDDDFVVSEDTIVLDNATINRGLTARELNALIAVVMMLCSSETIEGDVSPEYIKRQLYKDKQKTIPQEALILCSKVVNNLKRISLKKDAEVSFINCYKMRYLRNVLVNFAGAKTKFKKGHFYPITIFSILKVIRLPASNNERTKDDFGFSFYYSNQYDLQFVELKKSMNKDLQKTPIINQEQPCLVIDNSQIEKEIKQLNDAIKIQKKEYAALGKSIRVEEWNRMNLGRSFRAKEKSNHLWDTKLYKQLKEKRSDCDNIYSRLRKSNSSLKDLRYRMFALNKARRRQLYRYRQTHFKYQIK
ncbi:hypothetical protein INT47_005277 [Mucor saturninus]|uniref:Uncharacterized protein n=1 Tax=Mucor saturninus TaxID=64648 RepID=A0A8H7V9A7_9FUNG|nr:hypothetical protein INT47_005277 [Mucor saturninus]